VAHRSILFLFPLMAGLLVNVATSPAATLETSATVELVEPISAAFVPDGNAAGTWQLTGSPDHRVHLSIELRDWNGNVLQHVSGDQVTLDAVGEAAARIPAPTSVGPHAPLSITTLVICRE